MFYVDLLVPQSVVRVDNKTFKIFYCVLHLSLDCAREGKFDTKLLIMGILFAEKLGKQVNSSAEAIRTTVVRITPLIRMTVVPISGVIGPTVVRIVNATGIDYRHDGSLRFSNKLAYALNY